MINDPYGPPGGGMGANAAAYQHFGRGVQRMPVTGLPGGAPPTMGTTPPNMGMQAAPGMQMNTGALGGIAGGPGGMAALAQQAQQQDEQRRRGITWPPAQLR